MQEPRDRRSEGHKEVMDPGSLMLPKCRLVSGIISWRQQGGLSPCLGVSPCEAMALAVTSVHQKCCVPLGGCWQPGQGPVLGAWGLSLAANNPMGDAIAAISAAELRTGPHSGPQLLHPPSISSSEAPWQDTSAPGCCPLPVTLGLAHAAQVSSAQVTGI